MHTPQISVFIAMSLDGFIAKENGDLSWLDKVSDPEGIDDYGFQVFMESVDSILLGRNTYDQVLKFGEWPFSNKRVWVWTHRDIDPKNDEVAVKGPLRGLQVELGKLGAKKVYLDGGLAISNGLKEDIVDEMTISLIPVLLGRGIRLFDPGIPMSDWRVMRSQYFKTGLIQTHFKRSHGVLGG